MNSTTITYSSDYFNEGIFETDYQTIATAIFELYHPTTVAEFGCGPGHLSRELAKLGVQVTAVDGYSKPNFEGLSVEFHQLDLNDSVAIANCFANKHFDLAISLEVAEHLEPQASATLIMWLARVAPVVVFAAAVPGQGGHGHINLRPREYWHKEFTQCNYVGADRVREKLRTHPSVAPWYRYNILDYVHVKHPQVPSLSDVISRLIASESAVATAFYKESTRCCLAEARLKYAPVQWYLKLRKFVKSLLGRG
ncbi:class I SAM-dependent methyltransferase [Scytonema sp. NUACC26]|uniref:class I SAM-dependent methyltransferase n=1 Tax=Scytonema sp. NUACC26 TaxID=3140176 RepID=UPI0034DC69AD